MPSIKRGFWVSAERGFIIVVATAGGLGMTASGLQAAPEHPAIAALQVEVSTNWLRGCGLEGRGAKRFVVRRAGGGTRTIEICNAEDRGNLSATAQALSLALDAAADQPSGITSDPRTLDLLSLRLERARTDLDTRMDADTRSRKLTEIDDAIKSLEGDISRKP